MLHGERVALVPMMILIMATGAGVVAPPVVLLRHLPVHSLPSHLHSVIAVIVVPARIHVTSVVMVWAATAHMASVGIVAPTEVVVAHVASATRVTRTSSLVMATIALPRAAHAVIVSVSLAGHASSAASLVMATAAPTVALVHPATLIIKVPSAASSKARTTVIVVVWLVEPAPALWTATT